MDADWGSVLFAHFHHLLPRQQLDYTGPIAVLAVPPIRKSLFGWKPVERPPTTYPRALSLCPLSVLRLGTDEVFICRRFQLRSFDCRITSLFNQCLADHEPVA